MSPTLLCSNIMDLFQPPRCDSRERFSCLWDMQQKKELCDVVLELDSHEQINAHKCVLAACSPYFRTMFTCNLSESNQHSVRITHTEYDIMEAVISFAYSSKFTLPCDRVLLLLSAADHFQIDSLLQYCCGFLETQLNTSNVLSTRAYACLHRCWKLYRLCTEYVLTHFNHVIQSEEFLDLPTDQLQDLISQDELRVTCEEDVYTAVINWVYHDFEERKNIFPSLIVHVRLPFLSSEFLTCNVQEEQLMERDLCQDLISEAFFYKSSPDKRGELKNSLRVHPRKLFGLQEVILAIGGANKEHSVKSVDQYNFRTDSWSTIAELPSPRYGLATCFYNGYCYVSGGSNETHTYINAMDRYSMTEDKWCNLAPLPTARRYHSMVVLYGLLYAIGGQNSNEILSSVERYDPVSNTWSIVQPLNTKRMYHGTVELDGFIYVIGGHCGLKRLDSVECYNSLSDQWNHISNLPEPRSVIGATALAGVIYVAGGYNGKEHVITVNCYDIQNDKWLQCPSLRNGRSAFGMVTYNGYLYACGGFNGCLIDNVECFIPGDDQWTPVISMLTERIHFSMVNT